jgi:hypothetical protein
MVVTDQFVYIHKPKTGGTFVTDALLKLYEGKWSTFIHARLAIFGKVHFRNRLGTLTFTSNKHGGCREIPEEYAGRTIVTTIRNPLDYYVSQYEFGWWKRKEWLKHYKACKGFEKFSKSFPELSFPEFMELMCLAFNPPQYQDFYNQDALGRATVEFIQDCFYSPDQVFSKLDEGYVLSGDYRMDMFPVQFIFTHRLNQHLYDFLLQQGYPEKDIAFIITKEKVLPQGKGRTKEQKWEKYYTPELKELVRKKDRFIFQMFPEFEKAFIS